MPDCVTVFALNQIPDETTLPYRPYGTVMTPAVNRCYLDRAFYQVVARAENALPWGVEDGQMSLRLGPPGLVRRGSPKGTLVSNS